MTEFKVVPHTVLTDRPVIEVWYDGAFLATVTPADQPGIRVTTKYQTVYLPVETLVSEVRILR
jgi:hypothetical protein